MKKFYIQLFVMLLFFKHYSVAHPHDAIINLGGDCQISYQLSQHHLRSYALPFDSLITPYSALQALLKNRFEDFMKPDNFEFIVDVQNEKYILDKKYGVRFFHDFTLNENFLESYETISEKYLRRIERLMVLIMTSAYPLFIRKKCTKEQAIVLKQLIFELRKEKAFLLVVLDSSEEFKSDWKLEGVRNYHLRQPYPYTWKGDLKAWREIFYDLGLLEKTEVYNIM